MYTLKQIKSGILICAFLQALCSTLFLKIEDFHAVNSVLFFVSGLTISFLLLFLRRHDQKNESLISRRGILILSFMMLPLLVISYSVCREIMDKTPLHPDHADMLPVMKVMSERFLNGEISKVYDTIPTIWNGIQPIYLPAMWMPFSLAQIFDFDLRWITVAGLWLATLIILILSKIKLSPPQASIAISLLLLMAFLHFEKTSNVIRLTEEGIVILYYCFLVYAIFSKNPWLIGVAILLCVLSRYSFAGWLPFFLIFCLYEKKYALLAKAFSIAVIGIIVLVVIPFGFAPLSLHLNLPEKYISHSLNVWNSNPEFFYQSLGFAKFFGPANVEFLHNFLLYGSFLIPVLFFVLIRKRKGLDFYIVLASCLQLSITIFYNFLDVSYLYLYYTPVFVSLAISATIVSPTFSLKSDVRSENPS
jgi:hypothetical protein